MDRNAYRITSHLVVIPTPAGGFIKAVYGAALADDAEKSAAANGGRVVSLSSYGWSFHAGQTFNY